MSNFTIWLIIALLVSVSANIFMFWYIRRVLDKLLFVSRNISDLVDLLVSYQNHLKTIYSLDTYYGDETIQFLMSHTKSLLEVLEEYEDIYSITVPIEYEDFDDENEENEEGENDGETKVNEKDVFYAGSRKRNN